MKVNGISLSNQDFKGLWGNPQYSYTDTINKKQEVCDFFEKTYHPCKDETNEEIDKALELERSKLVKENIEGHKSPMKYYIYPVIGTRLKETSAELQSAS